MARATRAEASRAAEGAQQLKLKDDSKPKMEIEEDVLAMPHDYSDEEDLSHKKESVHSIPVSSLQARSSKPASKMLASSPLRSRLPSRTNSTPPKSTLFPAVKFVKTEEFDIFDSQPKKKRKIQASYGRNSNNHLLDETTIKKESELKIPKDIPTSDSVLPATDFKHVPSTDSMMQRASMRGAAFTPPVAESKLERNSTTGPTFSIPPAMPNDPDSSAPSTTDTIFDIPLSLPDAGLYRRQSASSLSSVGSEVEYELSQEQKLNLIHDDTGDGMDGFEESELIRCPICSARVELSFLKSFTKTHIKKLRIVEQQKFCTAHRQRSAQRTWEVRDYPAIDLAKLETTRIPQQIPYLEQILRRKIPSIYLDRLDVAFRDSKSGRNGLQFYLKDGIVDFVKHGYYGPRGARVMSHAIISHMSEALNQVLQKDKVARGAGVGGYVNAVLVPELMVALVREDMGVENSEHARWILEESTELGTLLNHDDDETLVRTDDD